MQEKLKYDRLHEVITYNSKTGIFRWKVSRYGCKAGTVAGYKRTDGYIAIVIDNKLYLAHRLAWFYVHGYFPENGLDHINQIRDANWIKNLREVSRACNLRNSKDRVDNTSGVKGVYWHKQAKKWHARIVINNKQIYLGLFTTKLAAAVARHEAEIEDDWPNCETFQSSAFKYMQTHK